MFHRIWQRRTRSGFSEGKLDSLTQSLSVMRAEPQIEADEPEAKRRFESGDTFLLDLKTMTLKAEGEGLRYIHWGWICLVLVRLAIFGATVVLTMYALPFGPPALSSAMRIFKQ